MDEPATQLYEFGPYVLDPREGQLLRGGETVPLPPKVFDTLRVLVEHGGQVVRKEKLMETVWPDAFVEEANLAQNVSTLRKVLGEGRRGSEYIETLPRRGYRFAAQVRPVAATETAGAARDTRTGATPLDGEPELLLINRTLTRVVAREVEKDADAVRADPPEERDDGKPVLHGGDVRRASEEFERRAFVKGIDVSSRLPVVAPSPARPSGITKGIALAVAASVLLTAGAFFAVRRVSERRGRALPFADAKISRLTDVGNALCPALSPDGQLLAYVTYSGTDQSLRIRHVPTGSDTLIVAPAAGTYVGLTFSHDGHHIYFVRGEKGTGVLYRVPVLGGEPRKLIEDVWTSVTLSPDDRQLAFVRVDLKRGDSAIIVADADGAGERVLATREAPEFFHSFTPALSWSPDGKLIAAAGGTTNVNYGKVIEVKVEDGSQKLLPAPDWDYVSQVEWAGGNGLIVLAREQPAMPFQIWHLDYPSGGARRITRDFLDYLQVSLAADPRLMVAAQRQQISNIWVVPVADNFSAQARRALSSGSQPSVNRDGEFPLDVNLARQITTGTGGRDGYHGLAWTPDGRILYSSNSGGSRDIRMAGADGAGARNLTDGAGGLNHYPAVSPDGRRVVFSSKRDGKTRLWMMDVDGRHAAPLPGTEDGTHPTFSPDGRWLACMLSGSGTAALYKISVDGSGAPVRLTDRFSSEMPAVSPDGELIAYAYYDEQSETRWKVGVIPSGGGRPPRDLPIVAFRSLVRWSPGGRSLTYIDTHSTASNIWSQPLDGGPRRQLTNFTSGRILNFAWSHDGQHLALARGSEPSDIVLITDAK